MQTAIDRAGRLVIPKALRDRVGLHAGEVEIDVDGAAVRIEPVASGAVDRRDGWLAIPSSGRVLTSDEVSGLRYGNHR
ncbi:MAG: AbrB/MazE/SpoVT family DNA-binding domain-containing protein [Acidimicrobiales bacterium]